MQTRSQRRKNPITPSSTDSFIEIPIPLYVVNIDFDEASAAWRSNKKVVGQGHFTYICASTTKTEKKCMREKRKEKKDINNYEKQNKNKII